MKIFRIILILIFWFIAMPAGHLKAAGDNNEDSILNLLKIKPGMNILDIGTGGGYYAYKFAEKLKGTGKVFATDIDIKYINHVAQEAQLSGLGNLYPILVKKEGVDEFYGKQKYDLIFFTGIYFDDPVSYFREMKRFLAEDGRLVFAGYKSMCFNFFKEDFADFKGLIKALSREPENSPFYKGLRESTRELIKQKTDGQADELLKEAIVDDFNRMLVNPLICSNFLKIIDSGSKMSFIPEERDFINHYWQLIKLRKGSDFDIMPKQVDIVRVDSFVITIFNKLFLIQNFRKYLYIGEGAPYLSRAVIGKNIKPDEGDSCCEKWIITATEVSKDFGYKRIDEGPIDIEKKDLIVNSIINDAGYKLENEYNLIPFRKVLVFKANKEAVK